MKYSHNHLQSNYIRILDLIICLPFLVVPLLIDLPYRVNIYLSWEGAYRLMIGQLPFIDFDLPMGFGYWLVPAAFFKVFGPQLITLVKAQIFINSLSILSVRGVLYRLKIKPLFITISLLVFCLTYVIYNFWPWYNHTVVVYELLGLGLIVWFSTASENRSSFILLTLSAFFMFLAFFTKQDAGAMGFIIGLVLLIYHSYYHQKFRPILVYLITFFVVGLAFILPFLNEGFLYWFNYGQPPHNARLGIISIVDVLFSGEAFWEKIYITIILLIIISSGKGGLKQLAAEKHLVILFLLTLGLVGQAIVTRVTSPLPTDHMTYFHVFAIAFIFCAVKKLYRAMDNLRVILMILIIMTLTFSSGYWKYVKGVMGMNISNEDKSIPRRWDPWVESDIPGFEKMLLPKETIHGMERLIQSRVAQKENLKVLNMSELTPLALRLDYIPPTNQPLWYHLNIGLFQKEVDMFIDRIKQKEYDLVLFQDIPGLIHFFPFEVQEALRVHYELQDRFLAPRKKENSYVEVYVRKE